MRSRPKDLGTKHETRTVRHAQDAGLVAERIAEGGSADLGDVRIYGHEEWVIECKDNMKLNVHRTLEKTIAKAGTRRAAVVWRKMVRKDGNKNRTQEGPILVAMSLDAFLELLGGDPQ